MDADGIFYIFSARWTCTTHKTSCLLSSNSCKLPSNSKLSVKYNKIGNYGITQTFLDIVGENYRHESEFNITKSIEFVYNYYANIWLQKCQKIKNQYAELFTQIEYQELIGQTFLSLAILLPGKKWWRYIKFTNITIFGTVTAVLVIKGSCLRFWPT